MIFGHEALGVAPETLELVDGLVSLPMFGEKASINVGNAADPSEKRGAQGVVGAFVGGPLLQPLGRMVGQNPHPVGVAERIVVDGAGDGAVQQGKGLVRPLARVRQHRLCFLARQGRSAPLEITPRR